MRRIMCLVMIAAAVLHSVCEGETFYVAPSGSDANPGTEAAPFATLERARDAVRAAKASAKDGISVVIGGGVYTLATPVVFAPEDSGTAEHPVRYIAKPGERPVFRGGRAIVGWSRVEGDLWRAEIPEVKAGTWYFRQLFVNGERRPRTKLPQDGYYKMAGGGTPPKRSFKFNAGEIHPEWTNLNDVEVVVLQFWTDARLRIASIDAGSSMVTFTGDAFRPLDWNKGWYVENVREGLLAPGQWYLDRGTGVLTYWAKPGEDMEKAEVVAPVTRHWVRFEGDAANGKFIEHLAFEGLTFHCSDWTLDDTLGYSYPQAAIDEQPNEPLFQGWPEGDSIPQSQIEVPAGVFGEWGERRRVPGMRVCAHRRVGDGLADRVQGHHDCAKPFLRPRRGRDSRGQPENRAHGRGGDVARDHHGLPSSRRRPRLSGRAGDLGGAEQRQYRCAQRDSRRVSMGRFRGLELGVPAAESCARQSRRVQSRA